MEQDTAISIGKHFSELEDPRVDRTKRHQLLDIVIIAICGVICGADTWVDIEEFGKAKIEKKTFYPISPAMPEGRRTDWQELPFAHLSVFPKLG